MKMQKHNRGSRADRVAAILFATLWIGVWTAQGTITVTHLNEDFSDLSEGVTFGTPQFQLTTDGGRTVAGATNSSVSIIGQSITPADVGSGPMGVDWTYRQVADDANSPPTLTIRNLSGPIVSGQLERIQVFPRGAGTFQFQAFRYTNVVGDTEKIVDVATSQIFPLTYFTLSITRTNGVWQGFRSDTASIIFTATESTLATGSLLDYVELRDANHGIVAPGETLRYFDNLLITTTVGVPEPATGLLLVLGGLVTWWRRRRREKMG